METAIKLLEVLALVVEFIAVAIMLWGTFIASYRFVKTEFASRDGPYKPHLFRDLRMELGGYLLVALEFLIAADIIYTLFHRQVEDIILLIAIVFIRIVMAYFLDKELAHIANSEQK